MIFVERGALGSAHAQIRDLAAHSPGQERVPAVVNQKSLEF